MIFKPGDKVLITKPKAFGTINWLSSPLKPNMDSLDNAIVTLLRRQHADKPWWSLENEPWIVEESWLTLVNSSDRNSIIIAVNDYICPTCKNNRCSKTEKTCWRCGYAL